MTSKEKEKREYVDRIKTTVGCNKCGKQEPSESLHFHHVEGETKVNEVSRMVSRGYSLEELKNEIRKCEVLCKKCHVIHHGHSKQDCVDAIQKVAEELGKSPTKKEYREHTEDNHPSPETIRNKFDSWNDAKQSVGLSVFHQSKNGSLTEQDCIDALREVAETLDKSPSIIEYRKHSKYNHPSPETIKDKLGSWNEAKQVAGLSVYHQSKNGSVTEQDCIDALREVAETLRKSPTKKEYREHSEDNHPSSPTIEKKFDSWNDAKNAAGLTPFTRAGKAASPATERQTSFNQFAE